MYEVAYDEAARVLSEQLSLVDGFRARAGMLLSVAAISTSVLGARAFDRGSVGYASWVALASFFAVVALSLAIFRPRPHELGADSLQIVKECVDEDESEDIGGLHRALTLRIQRSCATNRQDLTQLAVLFELAGGLLAIEILSWIVAIAPLV